MRKSVALAVFLSAIAVPAMASSDDAWEEFAANVEQSCLSATEGIFTDASAVVDPFGSESYGLAVVTGTVSTGESKSIICVYNKQTTETEIGGELDLPTAP